MRTEGISSSGASLFLRASLQNKHRVHTNIDRQAGDDRSSMQREGNSFTQILAKEESNDLWFEELPMILTDFLMIPCQLPCSVVGSPN